jgi:hypothetical protein
MDTSIAFAQNVFQSIKLNLYKGRERFPGIPTASKWLKQVPRADAVSTYRVAGNSRMDALSKRGADCSTWNLQSAGLGNVLYSGFPLAELPNLDVI